MLPFTGYWLYFWYPPHRLYLGLRALRSFLFHSKFEILESMYCSCISRFHQLRRNRYIPCNTQEFHSRFYLPLGRISPPIFLRKRGDRHTEKCWLWKNTSRRDLFRRDASLGVCTFPLVEKTRGVLCLITPGGILSPRVISYHAGW